MHKLLLVIFLLPRFCFGQDFNRPSIEAVKVSHPVYVQLKTYLEKVKGEPVVPEMFVHLPAYNILNRSERKFVDGIYFFVQGVHDNGTLFINMKGRATILPSDSPTDAIVAYAAFLKKNTIPEVTQLKYLTAITDFLKFREANRNR